MFKSNLNWDSATKRAKLIELVRHFFAERNVVEVETPLLSNGTVTDVHLDAFSTDYRYLSHEAKRLYLQTSPEFAMKRLLASGFGCIYQITKAFRDEGYGTYHNPEFTMLEWYRLGYDHFLLMDEVEKLLKVVLDCKSAVRVTYQNIFLTTVSIDPLDCSVEQLKSFLAKNGIVDDWIACERDKDILLQFIFSEFIEKDIAQDNPIFVYDFPVSQAALAKISNSDDRVAERFECYFKGIELANGFNELTSADEQIARFNNDNKQRQALAKELKPIDDNFIAALQSGLPDCAGVALGIDRLMMIALKKQHINDVISFGIERA